MKKLRCAILDDYQNIALSMAGWSSIANQFEVISLQEHFIDETKLINTIKDRP